MAINFEAANMAGYNNPKIEVFKATLAEDGTTLAQYPSKADIMAAVKRGSIPFIMLAGDESQCYLAPITYILQQTPGDFELSFFSAAQGTLFEIQYAQGTNPPTLSIVGAP